MSQPGAMHKDPLTREEYFSARMIAEPLCIYDFCMECDGAGAVIVTTEERARDGRNPPVRIVGAVQGGTREWGHAFLWGNQRDAMFASAGFEWIASRLYERAGIASNDVDVALLYDHFTPFVIMQLEDFGFCARGEGGAFVESGAIRYEGGSIPTNTHGGHLSDAYLVGLSHVIEAVRQIRGAAANQIAGAELALVTGGPAPLPLSAVLLGA
jgi:acetyl-CoA acetyltransferase